MTSKVTRASERVFEELAPGARICRDIDPSISNTMSCSIIECDNFELEWTVLYDEWLYVLEGVLSIELEQGLVELEAGDSLWLGDGTWHHYRVKGKCKLVVAVYPGNWREIRGVDL